MPLARRAIDDRRRADRNGRVGVQTRRQEGEGAGKQLVVRVEREDILRIHMLEAQIPYRSHGYALVESLAHDSREVRHRGSGRVVHHHDRRVRRVAPDAGDRLREDPDVVVPHRYDDCHRSKRTIRPHGLQPYSATGTRYVPLVRDEYLVFGSPLIEQPEIDEVVDSLRSGWIGAGPKVQLFERILEDYVGAARVTCLSSCTAGLMLALRSAGVGFGD